MKIKKWITCFSTVIVLPALFTAIFTIRVARAEFPDRPITIVCGQAAGGPLDLAIRAISVGAEKYLGQPIVVETRAGGNGTIAPSMVAIAKPDGYKLCGANSTMMVRVPQLMKITTYKPLKSFTSIIGYATTLNALVVKKDAPWKNLAELIDDAKKNPGKVKYTAGTIGTVMHQAMAYLAVKEGINWVYIPQTGAAPAMTALLGGHVDACSAGSDFIPYSRSGAVRPLALYEEKRSPYFPDVPTLKELGYDFVNDQVFAMTGPAGLPPAIVATLETAFRKGMETPEFKSLLEKFSMTAVYYSGKDFDRYLHDLWPKLEKGLKETGIIKEVATKPY
jgi:tripartite-type tricarboxylate transporter receptor subunit TctC